MSVEKHVLGWTALFLVSACSSTTEKVASVVSVYKVDVRQGNFVTQEMVSQLKPGLTRDQVRFILGSPLVADMFHSDRWDYIYRLKTGTGAQENRRLAVFFQDDKLLRIEGDVVADGAAATDTPKPATRVIDIPAPTDPKRKK